MVLFVILVLVLIMIRYQSDKVAAAVLAISEPPAPPIEQSMGGQVVDRPHVISEAHDRVFGAIYAAQRAALIQIDEQGTD